MHSHSCRRKHRRGIAIVLVLVTLVLLSGLTVAFLSTATVERSATAANSGAVSARQLADTTTSLVINQIREATGTLDENGNAIPNATWASQPGAIRVYSGTLSNQKKAAHRGGDDGSFFQTFSVGQDKLYKLYS